MERSLLVHTGNLIAWDKTNWRPNIDTAEELRRGISETLALHPDLELKERHTVVSHTTAAQTITPEDRPSLGVTVKVFLPSLEPRLVKESTSTIMTELGIDHVDTFLLALPITEENFKKDQIYPVWQAVEELHQAGIVDNLGIADLDKEALDQLVSWAKVKPVIDLVNLASCCVMPKDLVEYAKGKDIQLLTHPDPSDFLEPGSANKCVPLQLEDGLSWHFGWVARYSTLVKCRGIVKHKGYLAQFISR